MTILQAIKNYLHRAARILSGVDEKVQYFILPSCDPSVFLFLNAPEQVEAIFDKSDAVVIEPGAQRREKVAEDHYGRKADKIDPGSFQFDAHREEAMQDLLRKGHQKFATVDAATHKDNIKTNMQAAGHDLAAGQGIPQHPLLADDARFAGMEDNVNANPPDNREAAQQLAELQNRLTLGMRPGQAPTFTPAGH